MAALCLYALQGGEPYDGAGGAGEGFDRAAVTGRVPGWLGSSDAQEITGVRISAPSPGRG